MSPLFSAISKHGIQNMALVAHQLSYATPTGRPLFEGLELSLGWEKTGLVGPNGCGKTTLLRLLQGELSPLTGHIRRAGRTGYLPQDSGAFRDQRVADHLGVVEGLEGDFQLPTNLSLEDTDHLLAQAARLAKAREVLSLVGLEDLELARTLGSLSGGEALRVRLGRVLMDEPELLLLDEPTNNLDEEARDSLYQLLLGWKGGLLVVSHDRLLLEQLERILELSPTGLRAYGGNFSEYRRLRQEEEDATQRAVTAAAQALAKDRREAQQTRERQEQRQARGKASRKRNDMPKIVMNLRRNRSQRTSARLHQVHERRIEASHTQLEAIRSQLRPELQLHIDLPQASIPPSRRLVALQEVSFRYDEGQAWVIQDLSLEVRGPERLALCGPNGSGKTSLLRLLLGSLSPSRGEVILSASRVRWLDQDLSLLAREASVLANYRRLNPSVEERLARTRLARFLFPGEAVHQLVGTLSGGERLRAALACVLAGDEAPELLALDEPTNDLDLTSLSQLEAALRFHRGALVIISHDRRFREAVGIGRELWLGEEEG